MATVVKRTSSSHLKSSPSSSSTTTTTTTSSPRRPSTRASEAAAAAEAMSMMIETSSTIAQDGRMLTPPPVSARSELALRLGEVSMNSPVSERPASPASASASASASVSPNSAAGSANGATSLFAQNRAMLLSGLAKSDSVQLSSPVAQPIQRRDSGNGSLQANRRLKPLVTVPGAASPQRRHPLSAHPHLGGAASPMAQSPRTISPCVYVKAVSPRRPSATSASAKKEDTKASADADMIDDKGVKTEKKKTSSASSTKSSDSLLSTPPPESRLVVSARVTPANTEKQPFTLLREFDLQELVEALPRPDHRRPSSVNILASPILHAPHTTPLQSPSPAASAATPARPGSGNSAGKKRPATDNAPSSPHPNLRRHTRQSSQQQQQQQQQQQLTPVKELPSPSQFVANGRVPIPICPHPSLGRLPGLAAIILSRRVEAGDTIEIPVPFPEAWPATVSYVYKTLGEAAATSEIKANLEYLGGQVTEV